MRRQMYILVVSFGTLLLSAINAETLSTLYPDMGLFNETLEIGHEKWYMISNLTPNSYYEVRISYPAVEPAAFKMKLVNLNDQGNGETKFQINSATLVLSVNVGPSRTGRVLLNTEKVMFSTDEKGNVPGFDIASLGIHVFAGKEGVSPFKKVQIVHYNIVLETLFFGAPYEIFKIIPLTVVLLGVAYCFVYPKIMRLINSPNVHLN